ncbi:FmdB family zinc ribbon protein [Streptosporangium sp. 'caverna']|uniref:FmdB family zinc ribbon protein n=1 Tax=Streptosporangium sp. 'caverna' TaxID=2202249 RepID=UPI0019550A9F|nr:zinc ribbon domain-containing protein [Streptosporangium sp. 'caverna']
MAIYELRCREGHRFEVIQSFTAPLPGCRECGAATDKVPSRFAVTGRAATPPPAEMMPQTWRGTHNADREYVAELRRAADARRDLEERHPELAGDRRPIIAHEGRYENAPLRAGDRPPIGDVPGHGRPIGDIPRRGRSTGDVPGHNRPVGDIPSHGRPTGVPGHGRGNTHGQGRGSSADGPHAGGAAGGVTS